MKARLCSSPACKPALILDGILSSLKEHKLSFPEGDSGQESTSFYSQDKGTCISKILLVASSSGKGDETG